MVHDTLEGCFVYYYDTVYDQPCIADEWYPTADEALRFQQGVYVSESTQWTELPDPPPGCQHDRIRPTKVIRDLAGEVLYREVDGKIVFDRRQ